MYFSRDELVLDTKALPKGKSVSVADVVKHRDGDAVWVVIDGEVYE